MILRADSRWGRAVAAFAAALMTLLVVQTPIATVDRLLHDFGQAHAANAFAGAIVDLPEHDHERGHGHDGVAAGHHDNDDDDKAPLGQAGVDDPSSDAATPGLNHHHHHHHDGPSAYGLADGVALPVAWSFSAMPFSLDDDLRKGIDAFQQDRPPKAPLAHVA